MSRKRIFFIVSSVLLIVAFSMILPSIVGGEQPAMKVVEKLPANEIPTQVYTWLNKDKESEGYGAFYYDGYIYLAARMGQRPTGGYAIFLGDVELDDAQVTVRVQNKAPKPWDMVTQVITYPRTVIKVERPGELPKAVVFFSTGSSVLAKTSLVNLDSEPGGE